MPFYQSDHTRFDEQSTPPSDERPSKRLRVSEITDPDDTLFIPEITYSASVALPVDTPIILSPEQEKVVKHAVRGYNIFFTGSAGSGKSTVLRAVVKRLRYHGKLVRITAPTGRAALEIHGTTTWQYAGWLPDSMKLPIKDLENRAKGRVTMQRLRATDVLIIDEISMVENNFFERLNRIMKSARDSEDAFGGVQLVVSGDFFQLPPVRPFEYCMQCGKATEEELVKTERSCPEHGMFYDSNKWAFHSPAWKEADFLCFDLKRVHRQTDKELISMLQKIRIGETLTQREIDRLLKHQCGDMKDAVQLFSTRDQVKKVNTAAFEKLPFQVRTYYALDFVNIQSRHKHLKEKKKRSRTDDSLLALNNHTYEPVLEVKKGMLVILLANLDIQSGLVNGSQGRVVAFRPHNDADLRKPSNKYAESSPNVDDREERNTSQYVTSFGGSYHLLQFEQMREFIRQERNEHKLWPVVQFNNGKTVTIVADCRISELGDDKPFSLLARTQIPLCPAWAITIHKSQGMTLDKVKVDLSKSFEQGQEYVALSRSRTLEGMQVLKVRPDFSGGGANEEVTTFMEKNFGSLQTFRVPRGLD